MKSPPGYHRLATMATRHGQRLRETVDAVINDENFHWLDSNAGSAGRPPRQQNSNLEREAARECQETVAEAVALLTSNRTPVGTSFALVRTADRAIR